MPRYDNTKLESVKILEFCHEWHSVDEIAERFDFSKAYVRNKFLPMITEWLDKEYPDAPKHPRQRYRSKRCPLTKDEILTEFIYYKGEKDAEGGRLTEEGYYKYLTEYEGVMGDAYIPLIRYWFPDLTEKIFKKFKSPFVRGMLVFWVYQCAIGSYDHFDWVLNYGEPKIIP